MWSQSKMWNMLLPLRGKPKNVVLSKIRNILYFSTEQMIPYHTDAKFFCSHDQVVLSQLWPSTGWFQNGVYTTLVRYEGGGEKREEEDRDQFCCCKFVECVHQVRSICYIVWLLLEDICNIRKHLNLLN